MIEDFSLDLKFTRLILTLSEYCNYRCKHCLCGDKNLSAKNGPNITYAEAIEIINSAGEVNKFNGVGFVGGEPFLRYRDMIKIADYIQKNYKFRLFIATNCYWATSYKTALEKLKPLVKNGLTNMLMSIGDFHLEFGDIENVKNALKAAQSLGIKCQVQNIITHNSSRIETFKNIFNSYIDNTTVTWTNTRCIPVGNAEKYIPYDDLIKSPLRPGGCSIRVALNVQPNGSVKPCCGVALKIEKLTMGNAKNESIQSILNRMEANPLLNSLIIWNGPFHLAELLATNGYPEYLERDYAGSCDACFKILTNKSAWDILKPLLISEKHLLFTLRILSQNSLL